MFLSDAPGFDEDRRQYPFAGRAGREYSGLYLPLAGLDRYEVYTTNLTKCFQKYRGKDQGRSLAACCSTHWLPWEIRRVKPEIIVTMGSPALRLFMPGGILEAEHGIPFPSSIQRMLPSGEVEVYWEGTVFPTYNPAAGMRSGDFMRMAMEDFRQLRRFLNGEDVVPHDQYPSPRFELISGYQQTMETLEMTWALSSYNTSSPECPQRPVMAVDTETTPAEEEGAPDNPFCFSFAMAPDEAFMVMASDAEGVRAFQDFLIRYRPLLIIHNILFDLEVLDRMGVLIEVISEITDRVTGLALDSMVMSYNQTNLPKGLKIAARRLLGVRMQDFDDLVLPFSLNLVKDYLQSVVDSGSMVSKGKKVIKQVWLSTWEQYRVSRQVGLDKRAARMLADINRMLGGDLDPEPDGEDREAFPGETQEEEGDDYSTNIWSRWKKLPDNLRLPAESILGKIPKKSIAHVPLHMVIDYACRDAIVTIRLYWDVLRPRLKSWRPTR